MPTTDKRAARARTAPADSDHSESRNNPMPRYFATILSLVWAALAGCNCSSDGETLSTHAARFLLASEPPSAQGVLDLRDGLGDKEQAVVVVGRIDPRQAVFLIADPSTEAAHEHHEGCGEDCPFCSKEAEEDAIAYVACVDGAGATLPAAADKLFGLRAGQTVVIRGLARRDASGNVVVKATGIYVRG
jgi:hypothetical protein